MVLPQPSRYTGSQQFGPLLNSGIRNIRTRIFIVWRGRAWIFSQVCFGSPRYFNKTISHVLHSLCFRIYCFHNEVGGGKLLGVLGAGQTNASASRFAVSGAPGWDQCGAFTSPCVLSTLPSKCTSAYIRCNRHFSIVAIALVIKKCGEAINQS